MVGTPNVGRYVGSVRLVCSFPIAREVPDFVRLLRFFGIDPLEPTVWVKVIVTIVLLLDYLNRDVLRAEITCHSDFGDCRVFEGI